MKLTRQRYGFQAFVIRSISILGIAIFLYVAGRLALNFIPRMGLPPCEDEDRLFFFLNALVAILTFISFLLLIRVFQIPTFAWMIGAILLPAAALLIQNSGEDRETARQERCKARSLDEAMKSCGARTEHYRRGKSQYGNDVLTLVAPGTADKAWFCLSMWSLHNGSVSIDVDESVYQQRKSATSSR